MESDMSRTNVLIDTTTPPMAVPLPVRNLVVECTTTLIRKPLIQPEEAMRFKLQGFKFVVIDRYDRVVGKKEMDIVRDFFRDNRIKMRKRLTSWGTLVIFFKSEADLNYFILMNHHFERVTWEW